MLKFCLLILFFIPISFLQAQDDDKELFLFEIEGYINADTGTVHLNLLVDTDYYPDGIKKMSAKIENKKFYFRGHIPYPQGYALSYSQSYYSSVFVVEPGKQSVICNIDSLWEVPKTDNHAMKEYEEEYTVYYEPIKRKRDRFDKKADSLSVVYQNRIPVGIQLELEKELRGYYRESDRALMEYVRTHPDSHIAFWKLIHLFSTFGYEKIFESILPQFSDSLRTTYSGQILLAKLKVAGTLDFRKEFPYMEAVNIKNEKLVWTSYRNNEFTFVDFWYSNCGPCIVQFPHLKETYERYKGKGFEILGISTDKLQYKEAWLRTIEKHQLLWPQYWDENGAESSKLSINKFPTNFLLDKEGKIIQKDLRPLELEQFLVENL